jgi:hypothetical protein
MSDAEIHIKGIEETINELNSLPKQFSTPKYETKFVGTVLANTISFLSSAANSLDKGKRLKTFKHLEDWGELMKAINRSFFSTIIISAERSLEFYVLKKGGVIESSYKRTCQNKYNKLRTSLTSDTVDRFDGFIEGITKNIKPTSADYLEAALKLSTFDDKGKKSIRNFFSALVIVRNKSSHSNPSLTEDEKERLKKGGLEHFISTNGELVASYRSYYSICNYIIGFLERMDYPNNNQNV